MTEATQTTFFGDFFGKEMSENSDLANQHKTGRGIVGIVWVNESNGAKSPTAPFLVWAPPFTIFFLR